MNYNTKNTLIEIAHLIHQAIITDDDNIAQRALDDVADALASLRPIDVQSLKSKVQGPRSKVQSPMSKVQSPMSKVQSPRDEVQSPRDEVKSSRDNGQSPMDLAPGVRLVRFAGSTFVELLAKVNGNRSTPPKIYRVFVDKKLKSANVYCDDFVLFTIFGRKCQKSSMVEQMAVSALHRFVKRSRSRVQCLKPNV